MRCSDGEAKDDLARSKAELVHVSRLSTMGEMASALAHELNQPLAALTNYLAAARRRIESMADQRLQAVSGMIEKAGEQALRAGQVIRRLRDFVAHGETQKQAESLKKIVEEARAIALLVAKERSVQVSFQFDPNIDLVFVDKVQIQQVLLNLLRNAIEAMQQSAQRELIVSTASAPDDMAVVSVTDTGPGISPGISSRLFQPFVTTKKEGMGIGLSLCRTIIESHGGTIKAIPNQAGGTIFRFTIPTA